MVDGRRYYQFQMGVFYVAGGEMTYLWVWVALTGVWAGPIGPMPLENCAAIAHYLPQHHWQCDAADSTIAPRWRPSDEP